jgi:hypothetical protein
LPLALFALGGADLTGGFCLETLSFDRPTTIVGPILDTIVISRVVVVGMMCEEFGRHIHMGLLHLLLCLVRACHFASSVVTLRGYKSKRPPLRTFTSSHTNTCCLLTSLLAPKKREREREREIFGVQRVFLLLLPSQAMAN